MIKTLKLIYKVVLTLFTAFLIGNFFDISNPLYCDSESINDFVVDRNENTTVDNNSPIVDNNVQNTVPLRFMDKVKRRISWYITAKNRGTYNSYDQYKEHWKPHVKLRSQFKSVITEDFKKARLDGWKARKASLRDKEKFMSDIRASRDAASQHRTRRYFEAMSIRKK